MTFPKHARNPFALIQAERWGLTGAVQREKAKVLDGVYGSWRIALHENVMSCGREQDDPFDVQVTRSDNPFIPPERHVPPHRYAVGRIMALPVGERLERFRIVECFEYGRRLRYKLESMERGQRRWWFAMTERQLMKLQNKRAGDFIPRSRQPVEVIWFGHVAK